MTERLRKEGRSGTIALFLFLAAGACLAPHSAGAVWQPLDPGFIPRTIIVAPTNRLRLIAFAEPLIATSTDGGRTWNPGVPLLQGRSFVVFDGLNEHTLYQTDMVGGVWRSLDDGETWVLRGNVGVGFANGVSLVVDPNDTGALVAGVEGVGVFRSVDGGATWTQMPSPAPGLFTVPGSRSLFSYFFNGNQLRESTDGGLTWRLFSTGLPIWNNFTGLAIDPARPFRRYAGFCRSLAGAGGVWVTFDAGVTWTPSNAGLPSGVCVAGIALEDSDPTVVHVATDADGVFRSVDGGATWQPDNRGLPEGHANHPFFNRPTSFDPGPFVYTWDGAFELARRTAFNTVFPCRVADTRSDGTGPLVPGQVRRVSLVGVCGIPAEAVSVVLNVTLVEPAEAGVLALSADDPASTSGTGASRLPMVSGKTRATALTLGLGAAGDLGLVTTGSSVHVVMDVSGFFQ